MIMYDFRKHGISSYNPQLSDWSTHYIPMEASVKDNCQILLYVISPVTRGITSMLEVQSVDNINQKIDFVRKSYWPSIYLITSTFDGTDEEID